MAWLSGVLVMALILKVAGEFLDPGTSLDRETVLAELRFWTEASLGEEASYL